MLKSLMFAAALLTAAPAVAQTSSATPNTIAEGFFQSLKAGNYAKAYQDIWRGTLMDKKQAEVENVISQTAAAFQYFGKADGYELMSEKTLSPSLMERTFLVRAENGPLFFRLLFYHGPSGWRVTKLDFGDDPSRLP